MKFTIRTALTTIAALAAFTGTASAVPPKTIIDDAKDGVINGDYSVADLRAADAAISADVREYNLWDEVYAAALARAGNKNAPKPRVVPPTDRDGNGSIDADERAEAAKETRKLNQEIIKKYNAKKPVASTSKSDASDTIDEVDTVDADSTSTKVDEDGGVSWPLVILVAAIIIIGLVGLWRVIATRQKPGGSSDPKRGPRPGADDTRKGPGPKR